VIALAWRLAWRDLRGGLSALRGLRVVVACLALGVAAMAGVGSLRASIEAGLAADGARILGGDLAVQGGAQPLPDTLRDFLRQRGARLSDSVGMRSMLIAPGGARLLVELKAVDGAWPLLGTARFNPAIALAPGMIAADQLVLDRLDVKPGETLQLGHAHLTLAAAIAEEPDRVATPSILGPRVLMRSEDVAATGLVQPGALVSFELRAAFPHGTDIGTEVAAIRAAFPDTGWRIRTAADAAPNLRQFLDRTSLFMTLVGLTALLVGGIGVANGVGAWLQSRATSVATLRCLGAAPSLVFASASMQVAVLAGVGIVLGLAFGAALPMAAGWLFGDALPVPPQGGLYAAPLLRSALTGALTAAAFALWPLSRAARIPGAVLFRDDLLPDRTLPSRAVLLATALLAAALIGVVVLGSSERGFTLDFCAAALATLLVFRLGAWGLMHAAAKFPPPPRPWARLGLGNLYRPGSATPLMLVSVGLGLSTLAAVALIQGNVTAQLEEQLPQNVPSFFFIDIQPAQLDQFRAIVAATPGVSDLREVPNMRARLVSIGGVKVEQLHVSPDSAWALRGDRGLTYAAALPEGTRLVEGKWWPADYQGPPLLSLDAALARGWGVHLGDVIRVNVLGRDIDLTVANLREVAWGSMGINFAMVASPGLLEHAPHSHIATLKAPDSMQAGLLRAVTDALPNVTGIRVADVLAAVSALFSQIAVGLAATGAFTLVSGMLVLAGAVASGQRRRVAEAVILKTLGASRAQIRAAWLVEFGVLGLAAGSIAALIGTAAGYAVVRYVMHGAWEFQPLRLAATLGLSLVLLLVFGYAGTAAALRVKPAVMLRND
jgi:putative ABC transport system permease protein